MLKILFTILFSTPVVAFSQSSFTLPDEYNFLQREGKIFAIKQSHDTLFDVRESANNASFSKLRRHYKILGVIEMPNYHLLKLERLDTIPLRTDPYPATRYGIVAIQHMNSKQLGYLPLVGNLTKDQMDSFSIHQDSLTQKFFYTYYSDSYMAEFSSLKEITKKKDANKIIRRLKSNRYERLINAWKATDSGDVWVTGLTAEILNKACLEVGYNPIGADMKISTLKKIF